MQTREQQIKSRPFVIIKNRFYAQTLIPEYIEEACRVWAKGFYHGNKIFALLGITEEEIYQHSKLNVPNFTIRETQVPSVIVFDSKDNWKMVGCMFIKDLAVKTKYISFDNCEGYAKKKVLDDLVYEPLQSRRIKLGEHMGGFMSILPGYLSSGIGVFYTRYAMCYAARMGYKSNIDVIYNPVSVKLMERYSTYKVLKALDLSQAEYKGQQIYEELASKHNIVSISYEVMYTDELFEDLKCFPKQFMIEFEDFYHSEEEFQSKLYSQQQELLPKL